MSDPVEQTEPVQRDRDAETIPYIQTTIKEYIAGLEEETARLHRERRISEVRIEEIKATLSFLNTIDNRLADVVERGEM